MPTVNCAVIWLLVPTGSPEIEAPIGFSLPWSLPLGPVPKAGDPGCRLNQSRMTWACCQVVNWVSATCGTCLNNGSAMTLPPPGPVQANGRILLLNVTMDCAGS